MMRSPTLVLASALFCNVRADPVGKVLSMISDLQSTVIKEGEVAQSEYTEFAEWCEDRSRDIGFQIKTGKAEVESLKATIAEEVAATESLNAKVEEEVGTIAKNEADLKAATEIRNKEAADF